MQLNRTTDYVVRIVYFLSNENRIFTSEEISEAIGCSRGYVISILKKIIRTLINERKRYSIPPPFCMAGWLFYLFIVMMIVPFGGSAQYNIARNVGFVSCGIRAINHQMIIPCSRIGWYYNIVMMNMCCFLS